jgi:hypothetical protein
MKHIIKSSDLKYYHKSSFDLYVRQSGIKNSGLGIFTNSFIPKDSLIDEYYGELIFGIYGGEYYFSVTDLIGINALNLPRCYMAMLNDASYKPQSNRGLKKFTPHNFTNNCHFLVNDEINKVYVYSLVDIVPNSELFISYGSNYWNN